VSARYYERQRTLACSLTIGQVSLDADTVVNRSAAAAEIGHRFREIGHCGDVVVGAVELVGVRDLGRNDERPPDQRQALLDLARINLGYTKITAPVGGEVSERGVRDGQYVHAGTQVISVIPLDNVWVIANYKETQLTHMAVGQKAEITVDTFPGHTLRGHVLAFAPASGAVFALLPPDNATGNFTKIVQRIAVKIVIDDADGLADRLVPGMSVEAKVNARDGRK